MLKIKRLFLQNRFSVLLSTLLVYMLVLVAEGALTGREARILDFENPFFDLNIQEFDEFRQQREADYRA